MIRLRRMVPGLMLGIAMMFAAVVSAQSVAQSAGKMDSCCCVDSCPMMKDAAMKNHASLTAKNDCCCCGGDSCSTMKKDAMKNHAASSDKHDCCCGSDSCSMKKDGAKSGAAADKDDCCCGDSCNMREEKDRKDVKKNL